MDAIDSSKAQMGGCGELVSSKAQMEKMPLDWLSLQEMQSRTFVKTSQQPHSWGQKFLSCPKCQSFQWMKDALKESMPEQKPSQLSSQVGGSLSIGSSNGKSKADAACGGGGGTFCGCGGGGGGTGVGCGLAFGANFIPNPFAGGGGAKPGGGYGDAASSAGHYPMTGAVTLACALFLVVPFTTAGALKGAVTLAKVAPAPFTTCLVATSTLALFFFPSPCFLIKSPIVCLCSGALNNVGP
ncbi:hypothetical protein IFM89_019047 [Coptis chinensis]|uniref:Uncharacterized protein n=1 Tax=Coptis chinensis TaxID=261450 RepID=A0A835IZG1_9MAGN|nr:hypothetical protein IFM89_019047 [Coptis chinensis]